jgi:S-adenosylmethionine decarboxylase
MHGLHLTADLGGCATDLPAMTRSDTLRAACLAAVAAAGLTPVGELFHAFRPRPGQGGPARVTGVVLLAESHLAVHTWPELRAVTLDVYVRNLGGDNSTRAETLMHTLQALFAPTRVQRQRLWRGGVGELAGA